MASMDPARSRPSRALTTLVIVATSWSALVVAGTPAPAVAEPPTRTAPIARAVGPAVSFSGADVITSPTPTTILRPTAVTTDWRRVAVVAAAKLPAAAAGAVLVRVTVRGASRSGTVSMRATGVSGSGHVALRFATTATSTVSVVPLGADGSIQVRSSTPATVAITSIGWVPTMSGLVVPATAPAPVAGTATARTGTLRVVGGSTGVPADAASVLLAIHTTSTTATTLSLWSAGAPAPAAGEAVGSGQRSRLVVVRPSAGGKVNIRSTGGAVSLSVQVLAWATESASIDSFAAPKVLGSVRPGAARTVTVAGAVGVPAAAKVVAIDVSAPVGATVTVWPTSTASGTPLATFVSDGGATSLVIPVPSRRTVAVLVTGTTKTTRITATGHLSDPGGQQVSFVPKAGTTLLGPTDVVSLTGPDLTVSATAPALAVGDHVLARPPSGAAAVIGAVTAVTVVGGTRRVTLAAAPLADAFADYDVSFSGPLHQRLPASTRSGRALSPSVALTFFDAGNWSCSGAPATQALDVDLSWTGSVNADIDLSERSIDLSVRGGVQVTLTLTSTGGSVSCSVSGDLPFSLPLGSTGLSLTLGGSASVGFTMPTGKVQITGAARMYAAFSHQDGTSDSTGTLGFPASVSSQVERASATLELGISAMVGPAEIGGADLRWWEAGLTAGIRLSIGPPNPSDDPHNRSLRGPNCVDAQVAPYVQVGGSITVPFWPDISISVEPFELPAFIFYKGPCWGYSGTITYAYSGSAAKGEQGCTAESCRAEQWTKTWTKTLIPQAASFDRFYDFTGSYGSPVLQPYTWTASSSVTVDDDIAITFDGQTTTPCHVVSISSGSGTQNWGTGNSVYRTLVFEGWDLGHTAMARSGVPEATVTQQRTVTGRSDYCGTSGSDPVAVDDLLSYGAAGALDTTHPAISLTMSGHPQFRPTWVWTATVNLVRGEYPRD